MDEDLKQLIQETDLQREYFERLQKTLGDYIHIYGIFFFFFFFFKKKI